MRVITRMSAAILGLMLVGMCPSLALADLSLVSAAMAISVDEETGDIRKLDVKTGRNSSADMTTVLENSNLLSLGERRPLTINSQKIVTDQDNRDAIVTLYDFGENLTLRRELSFGSTPYSISAIFELQNLSGEALDIAALKFTHLSFAAGFKGISDHHGGYGSSIYSYREPFISQAGDFNRLDLENIEQHAEETSLDWFGWVNRYFVVAIRSLDQSDMMQLRTTIVQSRDNRDGEVLTPENLSLFVDASQIVQPEESLKLGFEIISAPKDRQLLSSTDPSLDGVVLMNLWSWFRWICIAASILLDFLFQLSGNWVLTITLVALVVRLFTIPITRSSLQYQRRAAIQQQRLKSLMRPLQEKYKGIELSRQIVDLHEKENIDQLLPFKGMLGLFVQIPIFIALFNVLAEFPALSGISFLWINDLALSDRLFPLGVDLPFLGGYFNLLPFIMALVTVLSTYYARASNSDDQAQHGALFGMAAVFFVLFYSFPAALVLYWTFSNAFQLIQQVLTNHLTAMGGKSAP